MANLLQFSIDDNYVFYDRMLDENQRGGAGKFWPVLGAERKNQLEQKLNAANNYSWSDVADNLEAIAQQERAHEIAFLQQVFGIKQVPTDGLKYIKLVNDCIGLGEATKNLVQELAWSIDHDKISTPTMFSFFDTYLHTAFNQTFNNGKVKEKIVDLIREGKQDELDTYYDENLHNVVKHTIEKSIDRTAESDKNLKPFHDFMSVIEPFLQNHYDEFYQTVVSYYHLDKAFESTKKYFETLSKQTTKEKAKKKKGEKSEIRSIIEKHAKYSAQGTGFLEEYTAVLIAEKAEQAGLETNYHNTVATTGVSNMQKTDSFVVWEQDSSIKGQELYDEYFSDFHAADLTEATQHFNDFAKTFSKTQDSFITYTNAKNYSLRQRDENKHKYKWEGFSGGEARAIVQMDDANANVSISDIRQVLMNTAPETILQAKQGQACEVITRYLTALVCNTLFDDWVGIGSEQITNGIHLFQLDELTVPLSWFCTAIVNAIHQVEAAPTSLVSVNIDQPQEILYRTPEASTAEIVGSKTKDKTGKTHTGTNLVQLWNKQRADSLANTTFDINFFYSFKDFIKNELTNLYN